MKILIYGMSSLHGGVESFIYNYVKYFDTNIHVDFVTDFASIPFQQELEASGSKVFSLPSRRKNYFKYKKTMQSIFETTDYDIVWSNVCSLSSIEVLEFAKKNRVPVRIVHSHNSQIMSGKISNYLHTRNKKKIANVATDFWACSKEAGQWMFDGTGVEDVLVVNNAIDALAYEYSEEQRKKYRKELNLEEKFVVGHVGRFHHQKNHPFLFEIFKEIIVQEDNAMLVLVGSGDEEDAYRNLAISLGIQDHILWLGQRKDVNLLMQAFDVFVLPSKFEGLPFVLIEAQAAGLPSFTTKETVGKDSKITELLTFISKDESPKAWAEEILKHQNVVRKNMQSEIEEAGFDIRKQSQDIQKRFYTMRKKYDKK